MFNCSSCGCQFTEGTTCSICKGHYDFPCSGITEVGYRKLGNRKKSTWRCPKCKSAPPPSTSSGPASPQPSQFDMIQEQLNAITLQLVPLSSLAEDMKIIKGEISGLKKSLEMAYSLINESSDKIQKLETRVTEAEKKADEVPALRIEIDRLHRELQDRDQWARSNNVEIRGVPIKKTENLYEIAQRIGDLCEFKFKKDEINYIARIPTRVPNAEKSIVLSFNNRYRKEELVVLARKSKQLTLANLGFSAIGNIYVNDHLTTYNKGEWRGERRMLDITRDKPVKVCVRVVVPVRDHPKFNFVGKLLGPKGNSLKRLQEDTMCKMAVLGRGSMKDRQKEEELRVSGDPKFAHLSDELHVEISAFATPAEAHARIAYALAELRRFLVPDYNDDIRQEQMLEMQILSSQNDQRRPTPPDSSRSGSEETLPMRDTVNKHRLPAVPVAQALPAGIPPHHNARDFSPPTPTPAPDHLSAAHHQLAGHGVLVGGGVLQQPPTHHLLTQNSILGGGDILGLSSPVLGGVLHAHPALRGVKPAAVHALATQGAAGPAAASAARKRPLLGGARAAMSPTKRAVMTLLARARAATHKHAPAWPAPHEHTTLLPLIRDDFVTGMGVNINLA